MVSAEERAAAQDSNEKERSCEEVRGGKAIA